MATGNPPVAFTAPWWTFCASWNDCKKHPAGVAN